MSSDENDRGDRDNTGREHRPKNSQHNEHAPTGSKGTHHMTPSPGGGTSQKRQTTQAIEQTQQVRDENGRIQFRRKEQTLDPDKPNVIETGNAVQDKELAKDHNVVSRDDAEDMIGKEAVARHLDETSTSPPQEKSTEGPKRSQSNFSRAFHQASGPGRSKDKDQTL